MNKLILANVDYARHSTDEGEQLQRGLEIAGWTLAGWGFDDGCVDVPELLDRHRPDVLLIQAREDWDKAAPGAFDKRVAFERIEHLANRDDIYKIHVVKDCPGRHDRRLAWCNEVKPAALLTYYHNDAVVPLSPWMKDYPHIRHRHTIDGGVVSRLDFSPDRKRAVVSGRMNPLVYPMRKMVQDHAGSLGVEVIVHPGYGNIGSRSAGFLESLARYRVSVACSSKFGFALRKILESAAAGCMVVTDLPDFDSLPWLDDALVRVPQGANVQQVRKAIDRAEELWTPTKAEAFRELAAEYYDWRGCGWNLSETILKAATVTV